MELIRPATVEDGREIASRIRPADRRETLAYTGVPPTILLPYAAQAPETFVGLSSSGSPEVIFGVDPVSDTGMGMIWMLGTTVLETDRAFQVRFLRNCLSVIESYQEKYLVLGNYMDERNTLHHHWALRMGFRIIKRVPVWGAGRLPFLQIIRTRKD